MPAYSMWRTTGIDSRLKAMATGDSTASMSTTDSAGIQIGRAVSVERSRARPNQRASRSAFTISCAMAAMSSTAPGSATPRKRRLVQKCSGTMRVL